MSTASAPERTTWTRRARPWWRSTDRRAPDGPSTRRCSGSSTGRWPGRPASPCTWWPGTRPWRPSTANSPAPSLCWRPARWRSCCDSAPPTAGSGCARSATCTRSRCTASCVWRTTRRCCTRCWAARPTGPPPAWATRRRGRRSSAPNSRAGSRRTWCPGTCGPWTRCRCRPTARSTAGRWPGWARRGNRLPRPRPRRRWRAPRPHRRPRRSPPPSPPLPPSRAAPLRPPRRRRSRPTAGARCPDPPSNGSPRCGGRCWTARRSPSTRNFFDAGATSIHLVRVQRRITEEFGTELSVVDMFDRPTVRLLAELLDRSPAPPGPRRPGPRRPVRCRRRGPARRAGHPGRRGGRRIPRRTASAPRAAARRPPCPRPRQPGRRLRWPARTGLPPRSPVRAAPPALASRTALRRRTS
ncbi:acyl carrier protein [Streptomyces kanasensis]|uniref:acyl carrier protein n=1 Tax=Streptomyces kanasensis TaxID=936756 RepID=UPI0039F710D0